MIVGIIFFFTTFIFHLKLSSILFLIGLIIFLLANGQNTDKINNKQINNLQIVIVIILLILVTLLITIQVDFEIFIILTIISILALKEFLDSFLTLDLQKRMTILFYILLIPLVIFFVQKVINILNMYPS